MIYRDIEQGTPEWFDLRCGKVTASRIADVMAKLKNGSPGATRKTYAGQLIAERLTGNVVESFSNAAMQWGTETEPQARAAYEFVTDNEVDQITFADHPEIEMAGASPDGLVGDKGLIEIKCPNTATHIDYLITQKIPNKYILQMQWQIECLEKDWCDFMSFDPRMPEHLNRLIIRVDRDDDLISKIKSEVRLLNNEIADKIDQLEKIAA